MVTAMADQKADHSEMTIHSVHSKVMADRLVELRLRVLMRSMVGSLHRILCSLSLSRRVTVVEETAVSMMALLILRLVESYPYCLMHRRFVIVH
jgi:hypothetical protein